MRIEIQGAPAMAAHVTEATFLPTRSKKIRSHGTSSAAAAAFSIPTFISTKRSTVLIFSRPEQALGKPKARLCVV
jgi:hypothetical protein